jgi:hypothetical protein
MKKKLKKIFKKKNRLKSIILNFSNYVKKTNLKKTLKIKKKIINKIN